MLSVIPSMCCSCCGSIYCSLPTPSLNIVHSTHRWVHSICLHSFGSAKPSNANFINIMTILGTHEELIGAGAGGSVLEGRCELSGKREAGGWTNAGGGETQWLGWVFLLELEGSVWK